jgi:hypothetical protein
MEGLLYVGVNESPDLTISMGDTIRSLKNFIAKSEVLAEQRTRISRTYTLRTILTQTAVCRLWRISKYDCNTKQLKNRAKNAHIARFAGPRKIKTPGNKARNAS